MALFNNRDKHAAARNLFAQQSDHSVLYLFIMQY